ncbi:hypothetical protein NPIL_119751 [Nephila pilipes]|uniref:Uncharacterized protein n=1 Tax=Nephila pilipes TaxID=299642 RepID=A0A8X6Q3S6_NEPPI|nr:hypothetical protein NPIL_119751 [Nephila pilipes]
MNFEYEVMDTRTTNSRNSICTLKGRQLNPGNLGGLLIRLPNLSIREEALMDTETFALGILNEVKMGRILPPSERNGGKGDVIDPPRCHGDQDGFGEEGRKAASFALAPRLGILQAIPDLLLSSFIVCDIFAAGFVADDDCGTVLVLGPVVAPASVGTLGLYRNSCGYK